MGMIAEERERLSDSPFIEKIETGITAIDGSTIRPAENHWHMVFVRFMGKVHSYVVGPLTTSGVVDFTAGAEVLWIKFRLGSYMPHFPARDFLNIETILPGSNSTTFWMKGSEWELPSYENVETFINRLARSDMLLRDPMIDDVLKDTPAEDIASRTVRHRFLRATGLTQTRIRQVQRAQQAAAMLRGGTSILDTVDELGYFDQPHLTRALKQWVGYTPAQLFRTSQNTCHFVQDADLELDYHRDTLAAAR
jgi:hypothetical protein